MPGPRFAEERWLGSAVLKSAFNALVTAYDSPAFGEEKFARAVRILASAIFSTKASRQDCAWRRALRTCSYLDARISTCRPDSPRWRSRFC